MTESNADRARRLNWWRNARFGLFIHWGVYAVPGGIYQGVRNPYYAEWLMKSARIPCAEYRAFARDFTADQYDPRAWVAAARDAGMRYIVITTKHHDGFTLWDSNVNDWTIAKSSPFGRDALGELVDACREADMPLGFYYSQAQDWMNGGSASGGRWDAAQSGGMDAYVDGVVVPHLRELLTRYGPDVPALFWWDTPVGMDEARARRIERAIAEIRPGLIMNNRLYPGHTGDILTPEQRIPDAGYPGRDWETCMTMNKTWGFAHEDHEWKSAADLIRNLVDVVSKGGNYLLNVGPDARGAIPQPSLDRLADVGRWMKVFGESIIGTRGVILDEPTPWGRCTTRDRTLYAHVTAWPDDGFIRIPTSVRAVAARAMGATDRSLSLTSDRDGIAVQLPARSNDWPVIVIAIELAESMPDVRLPLCRAGDDGAIHLPAASGEIVNVRDADAPPTTVLGGKEATLTYWKNADEACRWRVRVPRAARYRVAIHHAVAPEDAGSRFRITVGDQSLDATMPATDSWLDYRWSDVGAIDLDATPATLATLQPIALASPRGFMNLKTLTLTPE